MNELLMVLSKILKQAERGDPLLAAVLDLLSYPLHDDSKTGSDMVCAVSMNGFTSSDLPQEAWELVEKWPDEGLKIGDLALHADWQEELASEVLDLTIRSGCGADCFVIMLRTEALLSNMADIDAESRSMLRWAAAQQCRTFYFG